MLPDCFHNSLYVSQVSVTILQTLPKPSQPLPRGKTHFTPDPLNIPPLPPGSFLDSALLYPHFWRLLSGSQSSIFPSLPLPTPTRFSPLLTRCRVISNPRKALGSVGGCRGEKWCRAFFLWVGRGLGNQSWRTQLGLQGSMDPRETVSLAFERWAKHSQITKLGKHETGGNETAPGVSAMGQWSACIYSAFLGGLAAAIWRPPQAELRHSG